MSREILSKKEELALMRCLASARHDSGVYINREHQPSFFFSRQKKDRKLMLTIFLSYSSSLFFLSLVKNNPTLDAAINPI